MRKRSILLIAAAALVTGNAVFFWNRLNGTSETRLKVEWIAFSPTLEGEQRADPGRILSSSEWADPRYTSVRDKDDPRLNLLVRAAVTCAVGQWSLATYIDADPLTATAEKPGQMPDRLLLGAMTPQQQSCVVRNLPPAYRLAKLAQPGTGLEHNWSAPDLLNPEQTSNRNGKS